MGAVAYMKELIPLVFLVINGITEYLPVIQEGFDRVNKAAEEGRDMSPEDWEWLNLAIAQKRREVRQKLGA